MSLAGDLDYALARIAARRARRPGAAAWRALESLRSFAAALAAARSDGFGGWIESIDARAGPHAVEAALRGAFQRELYALCDWMPSRWRPALVICASWVELPRLRAGAPRDADDARKLARLHAALPSGLATIDAAWWAALKARLASAGADREPAFARLGRMLADHRQDFAAQPPGNGWPARGELELALRSFQHTAPLGAATAFAWVALLALDHERMRGVLLPRAAREAAP